MGNRGGFWGPALVQAWRFCLLLSLFRARPACAQNQSCLSGDLDALQGFLKGLQSGIPRWSLNGSSSDCCGWAGVSCDPPAASGRRVVGLDLHNLSLRGPIADSLAGLNHLRQLNFSSNLLHGLVPPSLFRLPRLELLDLSANKLHGPIPSDPDLPAIQVFNISSNSFTGGLPVLAGSGNLTVFDISGNSFSGAIDAGICNASSRVQVLRFSMNNFSGDFPTGFGGCHSLAQLSLDGNSITGGLPDDLYTLSSLTHLYLQNNWLSGTVSPSISNLSGLVMVDLSANMFTGQLPDVFDSLKKLEYFAALSNLFNGSLPASLSNSSALTELNLNNNSLRGEIRLNFSGLANLTLLDIGSNMFTGVIPADLPECVGLTTLNLARNNLVGEIPYSFQSFGALSYLSLTGNNFSNVRSALQILQHLPSLTTLVLTKNFQGGEMMPVDGIRGFEKMEVLVIANCALSGSIPPWLANSSRLQVLDISWNRLSGTIPLWIGNLDDIFYLDISNNSLTGVIPTSLTQMKGLMLTNTSLQEITVQDFPFFIKRNSTGKGLQYNQASRFPPSLVLGHNMLTGPILPGFGDLKKLLVFDLSWNNLSGSIPEELSDMSSLESLDLSHNNLTGSIPSALTKLNFLSSFNVAFNMLVGKIPTGGQFSTFSSSDFEGNPGLCGVHITHCASGSPSPPTSQNPGGGRHTKRGVVIGMAIGIGVGSAVLFTVIYLALLRTRSQRQEDKAKVVADADENLESAETKVVHLFQNKDNKELSIDDILKSTNNFDQTYIVGCGGFGLVYKATLPDGRKVAIKRLSGDYFQMEREFQAEVETLSRAQHQNLVLLQGYCRIGSDRLLIYSYMENGSLDYWLHEKDEGGSILGWETRVKIAQGAARGLAYLHQSCEPHILHRDIKSSNILLDENFEAHLADFGLARLINPFNTHVTTDLVGTLGYIPPEYGQSSVATFKGDVYSFGVVLLELLTGRRPVDMCKAKGSRDVVSWVLQMKKEKREAEVFDPNINDKEHENQLMTVLEIASLCVCDSPKLRPLSQQIVPWLDNVGHDDQLPK